MKRNSSSRCRALAFLNLLIAVALVAVLAALLIPVVRKVSEKGKSVKCMGVMRNLGMMLTLHASEHQGRLPSYMVTSFPYRQSGFIEAVKTYLGDSPVYVECPANPAKVPKSSFDQGWMRYAYFGGIDPKLPHISLSTYNRWVESGLVPVPNAIRMGDSRNAVVLTDQTTDDASMSVRADTNHVNEQGGALGGHRLYLDGSVTFIPVQEADRYTAAGRTLYR